MDAPLPTSPPALEEDNHKAKAYEAIHNRLFILRIALTILALGIYLYSGASAGLAEGLRSRFDAWWSWPIVNGLYTLITVFGFAAFMFPLSWYSEYVLEHRFGLSKQSPESWLADYLKSLALELGLALVFFEVVYAFLRWTPGTWWIWASASYILLVVILSSLAPVLILPLFHKIEPLQDPELTGAVKDFAEQAGLKVVGVFRWGLDEKTTTTNAALAGMGRTRRIILGDTMLKGYSREEILAVLAHEVGHYKNWDIWRLMLAGAAVAIAGFFIASLVLSALAARFSIQGIGDIAGFPLFVFSLFIFSLISLPLSNTYSRRREFAADAAAVQMTGTAEPLVSALEKLATQNLADKHPPLWIEAFLHSHPSIGRRIARARAVEQEQRSTIRAVG